MGSNNSKQAQRGQQPAQDHTPCQDGQHVRPILDCMGVSCGAMSQICRNRGCGKVSDRHPDIWLCKLCWIREKNAKPLSAAQIEESKQETNFQHSVSLTFDTKTKRFKEEDFNKFIELADEENKEQFQSMLQQTAHHLSLLFDSRAGGGSVNDEDAQSADASSILNVLQIQPPRPRIVLRLNSDEPEPIINYASVRKVSETEFVLEHKQDAALNIQIILTVHGDGENEFEWVGMHPTMADDDRAIDSFTKKFQRNNPDVFLRCLLQRTVYQVQELRPWSEFENLLKEPEYQQRLKDSMEIYCSNPGEKFKIKGKIGTGGFSIIYACERLSDRKEFALKFSNPKSLAERKNLINEIKLLSFINSDYINMCEEVFWYEGRIYIFLELMNGGSMTSIVHSKRQSLSLEFIKYSLYCVAQGLKDLHYYNILHRDIKSDNILCNNDGEVKVADMGLSTFLTEQRAYRETQLGTLGWLSPEIAEGVMYSKEVDVWAFGCFAHELATGEPPFEELAGDMDVLFRALRTQNVPRIPAKWPDDFADLVQNCLKRNPRERWSIDQLLNHSFLEGAENYKDAWKQEYVAWKATQ